MRSKRYGYEPPDNALDFAFENVLGVGYFSPEAVAEREYYEEARQKHLAERQRLSDLNDNPNRHDWVRDEMRLKMVCKRCGVEMSRVAIALEGLPENGCVSGIELEE